jgi:hypothetical protein
MVRQDSTWRGATDLRAAALAARERLARVPVTVTIADRRTGRPRDVIVGSDGFDALVGLNLDDARLAALLVSVAAKDDRVLARFAEAAWNGLAGGTVGLMARAVNCAADRPDSRMRCRSRSKMRARRTSGVGGPECRRGLVSWCGCLRTACRRPSATLRVRRRGHEAYSAAPTVA